MAKKKVHWIVDNKPWCKTHSEEQQKTQLTGRKVQKNMLIKYKNVKTKMHGIVSRKKYTGLEITSGNTNFDM